MKLVNPKNPIMASWLCEQGFRLDAPPFLSGAIEARKLLEQLPVKKEPLVSLTKGHNGGIYNGPMFRRNYVTDLEHGVPFLTASGILLADLSMLPLLSKKDAISSRLSYLQIREGMTLISCSGAIGRMAYTRPEMDGMWSSQDVLKVVPNLDLILPGYLYAFLSSKFGESLVVGGTYGAIVQHIEPAHIANIPVPRLGGKVEMRVHELVKEAAELRTRASQELNEAISAVSTELQAPISEVKSILNSNQHETVAYLSELRTTWRLDGFYYNPIARAVEAWTRSHPNTHTTLGALCDVFDVPPFKHIYVQEGWGVPFFTSGEIFLLERKARKFLSKTQTKGLEKYILQRGWILLARSGQLGGIIGRPQFTDSALHEAATSDHVIRIEPHGSVPAGYLYAYLANEYIGYPLLTRTMAGKSVPALWPEYLQTMSVVLAACGFMESIDLKVRNAFELRVHASNIEADARAAVESAIEEAA